jgi:hypothetical protein
MNNFKKKVKERIEKTKEKNKTNFLFKVKKLLKSIFKKQKK